MNIYITRHGQTNLNKNKLMQGRSDIPLNENGRNQARLAREGLEGLRFDKVYASPLDRAIETASIIGNVDRNSIIIDERIIEADFGPYEKTPYSKLGIFMTLYWAFPEIFPAPKGVESIKSMVNRSRDFLNDISKLKYENVLIVCHGGIIRALCGCLENRRKGIKWRPKPKNCEIRRYTL